MQTISGYWDCVSENHWVYCGEDSGPLVGLRFESQSVHDKRSEADKRNYVVGAWNSWVRGKTGSEHLFWPENMPVEVM